MSASTLSVYSSSQGGAGNPGLLFGTAGDLLRVLDLVLVNGWTGVSPAGWSKGGFANSGNMGAYVNASPANSGNHFGLVINDTGTAATYAAQVAYATGWESIAGIAAPVGSGSGQFPTPAQINTNGYVVVRKSADAVTGRAWFCFADSLTFYLFVATGDSAGIYRRLWFGDFFSLGGSSDQYRCMIHGDASTNPASSIGMSGDELFAITATTANLNTLYTPRTSGGGGTSVNMLSVGAHGLLNATSVAVVNVGSMQTPNGADNAYYFPPVWLSQVTVNQLRGRFRGIYHSAHPLASFTDGQVVSGAGDNAGKTFQIVSKGPNSGLWIVETSATVETN